MYNKIVIYFSFKINLFRFSHVEFRDIFTSIGYWFDSQDLNNTVNRNDNINLFIKALFRVIVFVSLRDIIRKIPSDFIKIDLYTTDSILLIANTFFLRYGVYSNAFALCNVAK
ncbi:Uncharacterised protein [Candidatus Bartonella washoeensis]|nr:Uncharacterised protein [Bartonella washoeensis]